MKNSSPFSETKNFVDELFEGMKTSDEKALEEYQSQLEKIKDAYNEIIVLKENVSKSYFSMKLLKVDS